ncbi:hypothetical protein M408DRAFT_77324 [Serendipita vermifera MAFF 305830]|uniref:Condensin complex subunit 1 n=1 Tax=Serendipita vermifera MAFF 305830 TaxID=933852 RepID=A0A0C2WB63_SERVB|nr:hypothetical protein M408DRAFT_77324 [Serendipita vermifera MAFF 305830]
MVEFNLQEESQQLADPSTYVFDDEIDFGNMDGGEVTALLEGKWRSMVLSIASSSEAITHPGNPSPFAVFRSALKHAENLSPSTLPKILDSLLSAMAAELEATVRDVNPGGLNGNLEGSVDVDQATVTAHKNALEMYAFLLLWVVGVGEKVSGKDDDGVGTAAATKGKRTTSKGTKAATSKVTKKKASSWVWADQIPLVLSLSSKVLKTLPTGRVWTSTAERDGFIGVITRPAYQVAESEAFMKVEKIKSSVYKVICLAVKGHGHAFAFQISLLQSLQYFEHLAEPMAEILDVLDKEFDVSGVGDEVLREIAQKSFPAVDTKGPRTYGKFLVHLGEMCPKIVLKQMSLLLDHVDSEAYPMRIAMVEIIGHLIKYLATADQIEKREKKINSLFEMLGERFLDVSSYVRVKVLQVLGRIWELPQKFPKQRLIMTANTISSLHDKTPSVRRAAIALLTKSIVTHPYGIMHGGELRFADWEKRYEEVSKDLEKLENRPVDEAGRPINEEEESEDEDSDDDESDDESLVKEPGVTMEDDASLAADGSARTKSSKSKKSTKSGKSKSSATRPSEAGISMTEDYIGPPVTDDGEDDEDNAPADATGEEMDEDQEDEEAVMDLIEEEVLDEEGNPVPSATPTKRSVKSKSSAKSPRTPKRRKGRPTEDEEGADGEEKMTVDSTPLKRKKKKKPRKSEQVNLHAVSQEQVLVAEMEGTQIVHLKLRKRYYAEALDFIRWLEQGSETLGELLGSTHKTEVLEAMEYFRVSYEYGMESAQIGLKKMLHLIWSKDNASTSEDGKELKGIRAKLLECYRSIYFDVVPGLEPRQQVNQITKNMIELTFDATVAELTSLEEMLRAMMDDGQIQSDVIKRLWQVYSAEKEIPRGQRRGAIIVLGMIAAARRNIVTDRVDTLIRIGLGKRGKADLVLAKYTCIALQRLSGTVKKVKGSLDDKSVRLSMDSPVFTKLKDMIELSYRTKDWFGMAEQAINTIYLLGEQPDVICDEIIKHLATKVFNEPQPTSTSVSEEKPAAAEEESMDVDDSATVNGMSTQDPKEKESTDMGDAFLLSQLVFVVGHVAIKHIVYLELIERELKRRKDVSAKAKGINASSPGTSKEGEELDQVVGNTEDEIGDLIASVREDEMMYSPDSLLATFGPMIAHICLNPAMFKHQVLRTSAALSLSKLMCISSKFCEENLLLLLRMLETSRDPNIRSNIVIALGDIAVCFSTLIDENSDRLYKGLSDKDLTVKKNTLMVLTHLILNGMVKVKGQLGEMAKCLEDEDRRVSDLAKLFFTELSTKDNAIYNNIQDVISHLSVGPHAVDEEIFQSTMKYIFNFIEKASSMCEKQAENLVEKLCQRFRDTTDEKQWRNIAFCLSLLPYKSERSLKKLIEALPFYQDKLREETVFERFSEILQKARTNKSANKPDNEMKEFEKILNDFKEQGQEDQALEKRVEVKKAAAKRKATRRSK